MSKQLRVAVVSPWYPTPDQPNAGSFVAAQVEALVEANATVTVFHLDAVPASTLVSGSDFDLFNAMPTVSYGWLSCLGAAYRRIPYPALEGAGFAARQISAAKALSARMTLEDVSEEFDLVHAHVVSPSFYSVSSWPIPVVVTEHYSKIEQVIAQSSKSTVIDALKGSRFLTVSNSLKERIIRCLGEEFRSNIEVVPNIVEISNSQLSDRNTLGDKWIYVGSLKDGKNVDLALHAFSHFLKEKPSSKFQIIGDGPSREELLSLVQKLQISESVEFLGSVRQEDVGLYLSESDLFVHLSESETFGIATVEAILNKLPVVSLRNSGAEEAWGAIEKKVGVLLPLYSSPPQIAQAVRELCSRRHSLEMVAGARWVKNRYSKEVIAETLLRIYAEEVDGASSPRS